MCEITAEECRVVMRQFQNTTIKDFSSSPSCGCLSSLSVLVVNDGALKEPRSEIWVVDYSIVFRTWI